MFMNLISGINCLVPHMNNPMNTLKNLMLFDTEHLLKCNRNNWINDEENDLGLHVVEPSGNK